MNQNENIQFNIEAIKFAKLGYKLEPYSGWIGDKDKYFFSKEYTVGWINIRTKEMYPIHGYYNGYLEKIAKKTNYTLID